MAVSSQRIDDRRVDDQILEDDKVPFASLASLFERAQLRGAQVAELSVLIAGFRVRVRVVGATLARTAFAALHHLPTWTNGTAPDLRIDVWDAAATGIVAPRPRTRPGYVKPGILLKASRNDRFVGEARDHGELWLDRHESRIVGWFDSPERLNLDERARPFHKLLSAWLEQRGVQFVHAGLVACHGNGLLFVGNGGAGKSTSSIACLRSGMGYLGDDFVGFSSAGGSFVGHGIYGSCLLNVHHIKRFSDLEAIAHAAHHSFEDKNVVYLRDAFPGAMRSEIEIKALLLPRVVDAQSTRTRTASKAEALMAIAPTSVMFLPRPSRSAFERVSNLVESMPCFWLELGRDVETIPTAVRSLVDELMSQPGG